MWGKQYDEFMSGKVDGTESHTGNQICFHKHPKKETRHLENTRERFLPAISAR